MRNTAMAGGLVATVLATALTAAPPASAASLKIGVAPSPNGYVMAGVPTQIAVSGATKSVVYVYNPASQKYLRVGSATPKAAVAYTFPSPGIQSVKVAPAKGKAKVFKVAVYQRYANPSGEPSQYGPLVLPSRGRSSSYTAKAAAGCVLVDVGGRNEDSDPEDNTAWSLSVLSSGANPVTLGIPAGKANSAGQGGIPIRGDAVVQKTPDAHYYSYMGAVWTCVSEPW